MSQISRGLDSNNYTANVLKVFHNPVGAFGQSISCGPFWTTPSTVDQPRFFWEAWVCPLGGSGGSGQYWISEGYGGNHAILCSPVNGNIHNGTTTTSWTSDYTMPDGRWAHVACSWDGANLRHYIDGIVTAVVPFVGPRRGGDAVGGGGGDLYLAGSDHSNLHGKLALVRGWEGTPTVNPRPYNYLNNGFDWAFRPIKTFVPYNPEYGQGTNVAQFAMDFTQPALMLVDYSEGFNGRKHHGAHLASSTVDFSTRPAGIWVDDPTCPLRLDSNVLPLWTIPTAPATPPGAKVFDSFSRQDNNLCWNLNPTLGRTETGSLGSLLWTYPSGGPSQFGIFDGRAVFQGSYYGAAWVASVGSADMDVRVDRRNNASGLHETGVCLRVVDTNNMLYASASGGLNSGTISLNSTSGFVSPTVIANYPYTAAFTTLRVVATGTTINVYADATLIGTAIGVTAAILGQGAGIFSTYAPSTARRWDNFTVF